ncbi:MAG: response regulator transcription factor [Ferruginibacter sp.]
MLLADDHSLIRRGLKNIINTHFPELEVEETFSVSETLSYLKKTVPRFAIFDLQLSDGNMIDSVSDISRLYPQLDILVYTMSNEEIYGTRTLQLGAKGFLRKDAEEEEVIRALRHFFGGNVYVSNQLKNIFIEDLRHKAPGEKAGNPFKFLSSRELEVAQLLVKGKGTKEISVQMHLHANTVVTYKKRIFQKLSVRNLIQLAELAKLYSFF